MNERPATGAREASRRSLDPAFGSNKLLEIQRMKTACDNDGALLVDGSLPEPGPFDVHGETIAAACKASESWSTLQLIYQLVVLEAPGVVVELGTNLGFSSAYIAAALSALGRGGRLFTIDASPYRAKFARRLHAGLGLGGVDYRVGLFEDVLPGLLDELPVVDLAFIDGQHEHDATLKFFELLSANCPGGAVLLFDDILNYSPEMNRAWSAVRTHATVHSWAEFGDVGMVILGDRPGANH